MDAGVRSGLAKPVMVVARPEVDGGSSNRLPKATKVVAAQVSSGQGGSGVDESSGAAAGVWRGTAELAVGRDSNRCGGGGRLELDGKRQGSGSHCERNFIGVAGECFYREGEAGSNPGEAKLLAGVVWRCGARGEVKPVPFLAGSVGE